MNFETEWRQGVVGRRRLDGWVSKVVSRVHRTLGWVEGPGENGRRRETELKNKKKKNSSTTEVRREEDGEEEMTRRIGKKRIVESNRNLPSKLVTTNWV